MVTIGVTDGATIASNHLRPVDGPSQARIASGPLFDIWVGEPALWSATLGAAKRYGRPAVS